MSIRRIPQAATFLVGTLLLSLTISTLSMNGLSTAAASSTGPTLPYPGRLSDADGMTVADGAYDFFFALYDAEIGGRLLWSETQHDLSVRAGEFMANLGNVSPLPMPLTGAGVWLAISVRGPAEDGFTELTPRQPLSATAPQAPADLMAGPTCPHDHWGETWSGTGAAGLTFRNTAIGHEVNVPGWLSAVFATSEFWAGLYGKSTQNIGVFGESTTATGVHGKSATGMGGFFESGADHNDLFLGGAIGRINTDPANQNSNLVLSANNNVDVRLDNDGGEEAMFTVWGSTTEACNIRENGNLKCFGTKSGVVETAGHGARTLYAVESPEVWFEDFGAAALAAGEARIAFEPIFAETVNLGEGYHVYLTPECSEPVLLFVTAKSATGFTVKGVGLDGKPSTCGFDYRVVAKRLGYEDLRLEKDVKREVSK